MKKVRFSHGDQVLSGVLNAGLDRIISDNAENSFEMKEVKLLPPVLPSKIVCVGLNYKDHAKELDMEQPDEPVIFIKPSSSVIGPDDLIIYPSCSRRVDYEAELGVVIAAETFAIDPESVKDHILGYVCVNDVTARDIQDKDKQWTRAKSFNTFAPIGPWIETDLAVNDIFVRSYLNGELKQDSSTRELIFGIPDLVSYISNVMTLYPGDIISTGTPHGVGPMHPGDEIIVEIEGLGSLRNYVD